MTEMKTVSLGEIGGGAAVELFGAEMEKVLANIADPNTDAEAKRTITVKVTIQPNDQRDIGETLIHVTSKLASAKPHGTVLFIGRERRGAPLVAIERNQRDVFEDADAEPEGVLPLEERKTKGGKS